MRIPGADRLAPRPAPRRTCSTRARRVLRRTSRRRSGAPATRWSSPRARRHRQVRALFPSSCGATCCRWCIAARTIDALLVPGRGTSGRPSSTSSWNTWRWRLLLPLFFSRSVMGRLGRDPAFFDHVEGSVGGACGAAASPMPPSSSIRRNPYLHWILTGTHGAALPLAWRAGALRDDPLPPRSARDVVPGRSKRSLPPARRPTAST